MKFLLLILGLLYTTIAPAKTITVDPMRTLYIKGVVDGEILKQAQTLEEMSRTKKPIYIIINSPGGSVYPGLQFLTAMQIAKYRGVTLNCIVPVMAASMGFQILVNCTNRYAFANSLLLWHPMKIQMRGGISGDRLLYESKEMTALEKPLLKQILRELRISARTFAYHYRHETLWTGRRLKKLSPGFLEVIHVVQGAEGLFKLK